LHSSRLFPFWRWLGQKLIDQKLAVSLEKFKAGQQQQLETFKSDQQREMELLRHFLGSRISKIHEKEFEVLPKAWLTLHQLDGLVRLALGLYPAEYEDVSTFSEHKFEEFLKDSDTGLLDYQKEELRKASDRTKYYREALEWNRFCDANEKQTDFHNYLVEHRIFMTVELRQKFRAVDECLSTALHDYRAGHKLSNQTMVNSARKRVQDLRPVLDEVEQAIQKRLHYEDA
jgi:hypothetical protein